MRVTRSTTKRVEEKGKKAKNVQTVNAAQPAKATQSSEVNKHRLFKIRINSILSHNDHEQDAIKVKCEDSQDDLNSTEVFSLPVWPNVNMIKEINVENWIF